MLNCLFIINFILIIDNIYSQSGEIKNSADKTILITDSVGNILDGDVKDWSYNKKQYQKREIYNYLFRPPVYKDSNNVSNGLLTSFIYEINDKGVLIKWLTTSETNCEGFYVERAKANGEYQKFNWVSLGYVEGAGNSDKEINYEFLDNDLANFNKYFYRLKQIYFNGKQAYYNMGSEVFVKLPNVFEFYPAYPNPAADTVNISFYLPKKDVVSLFFMDGKDTTYILNHEPEERGFYKLTLDKESLGFENEIKRLYIDCKSCSKKKNFGDIQF